MHERLKIKDVGKKSMICYISTQKYCYIYYSFVILMASCNKKYFFNTHTFASGKHLWNDEDTTNWLHGIYICSESTAFEVRMITSKETILRFCVGPITDTYAYYTTSVYRRDIFLSLSSISNYARIREVHKRTITDRNPV